MLLSSFSSYAASALLAVLAAVLLLTHAACGGQSSKDAELAELRREVESLRAEQAQQPAPTKIPVAPTATAAPAPEFIIRSLSAGYGHVCALRDTGLAECWGDFPSGDKGQQDPPSNERFVSIATSRESSCGLREDGMAVCWGSNKYGQSSPPRDERFTSITAGSWGHYCGLREDGTAVCWGWNSEGQASPPSGRFASIVAGEATTCGIRPDGRAICWGELDYWRGGRLPQHLPDKFVSISVGRVRQGPPVVCGLRAGGSVDCWGDPDDNDGELSPPAGAFVSLDSSWYHVCGVRSDGAVACWGNNFFGQLDAPVRYDFVAVSAAERFTCGLAEDGEVVCWGDIGYSEPGRFALPSGESGIPVLPDYTSFDAASVLARFSTDDPLMGEVRSDAVGEIIAKYKSGDADDARVLELLHTIAPELSIEERNQATEELARLSEADEWDEADTFTAVQHLAAVVTGDEVNAEERIAAANEMVDLYEAGDLDADRAVNLLDTIAPGLSIDERRQASASLARLSASGDWNDADRMEAASEVFRLVTGVPLNAEERIDAAVDLTGVGIKIFDTEDNFDDRDIDNATEIIKQAISGELSTDSVESILGRDE